MSNKIIDIDWTETPHKHKWIKNRTSIFNNEDKITFPQFIAEMVIYNRNKYWKKYHEVGTGPGWSIPLSKEYTGLIQQATTLCNYFPHPDEDPLVDGAFRNYFRNFRITNIGQYRKIRVKEDGKSNITDQEKNVVKGVLIEYNKLTSAKQMFVQQTPKDVAETVRKDVKAVVNSPKPQTKLSIAELKKMEQKLNGNGKGKETEAN